jgi:hypothetical protein
MEDSINYSISVDELFLLPKVYLMAFIILMRMSPMTKLRMQIPLCRMAYMPMFWPILEFDLKKLEQEFVHENQEWSCVFYVSLTNETSGEHIVIEEDKRAWGPLWN